MDGDKDEYDKDDDGVYTSVREAFCASKMNKVVNIFKNIFSFQIAKFSAHMDEWKGVARCCANVLQDHQNLPVL